MRTSDAVMSTIDDATIEDAVRAGADSAGVELDDGAVTQIVAAVREALRDLIDQCEAEAGRGNEMQTMIRRELQRFWRQIGGRPNGYRTL